MQEECIALLSRTQAMPALDGSGNRQLADGPPRHREAIGKPFGLAAATRRIWLA